MVISLHHRRFCALLNGNRSYVLHGLHMTRCNTVMPIIFRSSYGTHLLDHLAAHGAGFAGSQVAVVAIGQIYADLLGCLHLETVHGLTSLGDIQLIVIVAHCNSLLCFLRKEYALRRKHSLFRNNSLTRVVFCMNGEWRKRWGILERLCYC